MPLRHQSAAGLPGQSSDCRTWAVGRPRRWLDGVNRTAPATRGPGSTRKPGAGAGLQAPLRSTGQRRRMTGAVMPGSVLLEITPCVATAFALGICEPAPFDDVT